MCGSKGEGQECTSSSLGYFIHLTAQKSLKAPSMLAIKGMQAPCFMNNFEIRHLWQVSELLVLGGWMLPEGTPKGAPDLWEPGSHLRKGAMEAWGPAGACKDVLNGYHTALLWLWPCHTVAALPCLWGTRCPSCTLLKPVEINLLLHFDLGNLPAVLAGLLQKKLLKGLLSFLCLLLETERQNETSCYSRTW